MNKKNISVIRLMFQIIWLIVSVFLLINERAPFFMALILFLTLLIGPVYCGWFCIFGTFQDMISKLGSKVLKKRYKLPKRVHNFFKNFRYVLLVFIFLSFLQGFRTYDGRISFLRILPRVPITKILEKAESKNVDEIKKETSDKKELNTTEKIVKDSPKEEKHNIPAQLPQLMLFGIVIFYGILSFFVDRPFCNYLCTEGARYGILGKLRLFSIKRENSSCVNCQKCNKVCPMNIEVSKSEVVQDPQCISCLNCIESCPVKNTLKVGSVFTK